MAGVGSQHPLCMAHYAVVGYKPSKSVRLMAKSPLPLEFVHDLRRSQDVSLRWKYDHRGYHYSLGLVNDAECWAGIRKNKANQAILALNHLPAPGHRASARTAQYLFSLCLTDYFNTRTSSLQCTFAAQIDAGSLAHPSSNRKESYSVYNVSYDRVKGTGALPVFGFI